MFKKFFNSAYVKAALVFVASGGVLIIFNNWVSNSKLTIGFEAINETLMPVYIGIVFAFLLCPTYNYVVRYSYKFLSMYKGEDLQINRVGPAAFLQPNDEESSENEDNRRNLNLSRVIATFCCLVVLAGILAAFAYFIIPQVFASAVTLATTLPQKVGAFSTWLQETFTRFPAATERIDTLTNAGVNEMLKWIQTYLVNDNTMEIAATISTSIFSIIGVLLDVIIGILIMVYLLNNKDRIFAIGRKLIAALFTEQKCKSIHEFIGIINETFLNFINGRLFDSAIIGVLTYVVLSVFNISFAPMISVLVGVTNVIPFFGPFIGAIPATLILLIEDPRQALYFVIIILIIQQIDGNIIGPKIVGNAIGISSFWVLISVLIGGGLFGFIGMALGVPVFAVIYRYVDKLAIRSLSAKGLETKTDDYFTLEQYGIDTETVASENPTKKKDKRKVSEE